MKREQQQRLTLTLILSLAVFCIMLVTIVAAGAIVALLDWLGLFDRISFLHISPTGLLILAMAILSQAIGSIMTLLFIRIPLGPVNKVISAMGRLSKGDYSVRIDPQTVPEQHHVGQELVTSFNTLAQELESAEMLRSDFVNNFSHEFKTPIVSIAGFAKVLKRVDLEPEQRREYLDIIEEESLRLSQMATNVLSLTKVENQTILSRRSSFNLAEQLRTCVLMLEAKWEKKEIDLELELEELEILADPELLKQVWINLLDNAIKFSPQGGRVEISMEELEGEISVTVSNTGPEIPPEERQKIFRKFYQADSSHSTQGNGVGLAIVKRVVQLHRGRVEVDYAQGMDRFTVTLPRGEN